MTMRNMYQAGCEFIRLLSLCISDEIVDAVLPFVTKNIGSADWRLKKQLSACSVSLWRAR